jgi:hypothetical protein
VNRALNFSKLLPEASNATQPQHLPRQTLVSA